MKTPRRPVTLAAVSTRPAADDANTPRGPTSPTRKGAAPTIAATSGVAGRDPYAVAAVTDTDRSLHAAVARLTGGLSPAALAQAYWDWAIHLASAPGKQVALIDQAMRQALRFGNFVNRCAIAGGTA